MKFKLGLFFLIVIIIIVSVFVFQNSVEVPIVFYPGNTIHLPLSIVVISSIIIGIILMFLFFIGIEMRLRFQNRKIKKELEKKEKSLDFFKKGLLKYLQGNLKDAKKDLQNALKYDDRNISPLIILKNIEEEAIDKFPAEFRKYYRINNLYEKARFEEIVDIAEELLKDDDFKNIEVLEKIKIAYLKTKNYDKAIQIQNRIVKLSKNGKDELIKLSYLKAKNSNDLNKVLDFIKKNPKIVSGYILKFQLTGNSEPLVEGYKKTGNKIFLYLIFKNFDENVLKKCGKDDDVKIFLAVMLAKKDNKEEAISLLNTINNNLFVDILKCVIEKNLNEFEKFIEIFCDNCKKIYSDIFDICNNCSNLGTIDLQWKF